MKISFLRFYSIYLDFNIKMVSLSVSNLSKSFRVKDKNIQVLSDISINFPDNGIVGLLGKNGAGKTTFIKSCVNLISYDGIIKYYGEDLQILYKKGIHTNYFTALFEGNRNIYWKLTPIENIKYFAGLRGVKYNLIEKKSLKCIPSEIIESFSSVKNIFSDIELPNCPQCDTCNLFNSCRTRANFSLAMEIASAMKNHGLISQDYIKKYIG